MKDYFRLESPISDQNVFYQNILIFVILAFSYIFFISPLFTKSIFPFLLELNPIRIITSVGILLLANSLVFYIKDEFLKTIWFYAFNLQLQGALVYYALSPNPTFSIVGQGLILIILLFLSDKFNPKLKDFTLLNIEKSYTYILVLSAVLMIPFLVIYGKYITLENLMFKDIYKTRILFREIKIPTLNYLTSPLSRVILPAVLIISLYKRKVLFSILAFLAISYLFLCGATKSILVGAISAIFFYPGKTWLTKTKLFTHLITVLFVTGLLSIILFNNSIIYDAFIRRVFFVPPYLDNLYHQHFLNDFTFWKHSSLAFGFPKPEFLNGQDLTMYFGEHIIHRKGMNANIGILTEGFISYGYIGALIHSVFYVTIFTYIRFLKISPIFFGILFSYIFYLNTSLTSTLILTHGLLFLLAFLTLFLKGSLNRFKNR